MRIGILGAGQLGRMLALAGYPLGLQFRFLDAAEHACGAELAPQVRADFEDPAAIAAFCDGIDVATLEFENVSLNCAEAVAARVPLHPGCSALQVAQDRLNEKRLFEKLGIAVPRFVPVASRAALDLAVGMIGLPAVLKTRRMGYDGKGQAVLRRPEDLDAAWARLGSVPLILEAFVAFEREVSCIGVRASNGDSRCYPLIHNTHRNGILQRSLPLHDDPLQTAAEAAWTRLAEQLNYVGVLAFEFFVTANGLLANEIAPRVHNSGHWSIEGAECSQFENHLRAISGLPLGSTALRGHSGMLNLIGHEPSADAICRIEGAHLHRYGKTAKPGRKLGHVTVTAPSATLLQTRLAQVEALIAGTS